MTDKSRRFDNWIRTTFRELNTELEALYFAQTDKGHVDGLGDLHKRALCTEGDALIAQLLQEGNTDEGFEANFQLLGNVGFYMAACNRHNITETVAGPAARLRQASSLAMELGACIGVAPRFSSSHLMTHNVAQNGRYKTFTSLDAERIFIDYNTLGVLAYKRAADALLRIHAIGVSHPIAAELFRTAVRALQEVAASNDELHRQLDVDRFFYNVRPYYKSYRVGFTMYRGANAGDFAGINVIDLLLGLCQSNQASYSQLLVDKFLYMMPEDQLVLRDCMRHPSLMNRFLDALEEGQQDAPWFQSNVTAFLETCDAHGKTAAQHHDQLVGKYITEPAGKLPAESQTDLTASGPPLPVVLAALANLRDQRLAAKRDDIPTRHADIERLRKAVRY